MCCCQCVWYLMCDDWFPQDEYGAWLNAQEGRLPVMPADACEDEEERAAAERWNRDRMADATGRVPLLLSLFLSPLSGKHGCHIQETVSPKFGP